MIEIFRALLGLPPGASTVADDVDLLHMFVITVTMAVSFYVFVAAAWFTVRYYRKRKGQLTEHVAATRLHEGITIVVVLGMFLLWWVIGFRQYLHMARAPQGAAVVYVEAKQWMWKFSYPDGRDTTDVLTVPVDTPISLSMTSRDVIHSFYVPAFRIKSDVVPGRTMNVWFEAKTAGRYPIWCAEYCGVSHSLMLGEVVVLSQEDYALWKRAGGNHGGDLVTIGREVAVRRACVACHTLDGQRHVGPTWKGLYGSERILADGRHVIADDEYLTRSMMEPNADLVAGYPQVMPTYQGTLTAAETGALVELIRSLRTHPPGSDLPADAGIALPALDVTPADAAAPRVDGGAVP